MKNIFLSFCESFWMLIIGLVMVAPAFFLLALITMWLWNAILPVLFVGFPTIGYWQMLGLMFMMRLLFVFGTFSLKRKKN